LSFTWWDMVFRCIVPWVLRKKMQKTEVRLVVEIIFCTFWVEHVSKTADKNQHVTKSFIWRYATHVDSWNQNLRSMSTKCGMFAIHVLFSFLVRRLHNNLMGFGFWDMCIVWVKSLMDETQHISKTVLSQVVGDMVGPGFEMHTNCSLRYMLHVDCNVKGTSQNPGTWQIFLEICDTRWWVKTTIWIPRKLVVCSPWFLRCSLDEVCGEWNATYLKNST